MKEVLKKTQVFLVKVVNRSYINVMKILISYVKLDNMINYGTCITIDSVIMSMYV